MYWSNTPIFYCCGLVQNLLCEYKSPIAVLFCQLGTVDWAWFAVCWIPKFIWILKCSRHPPIKWAQRSDELYITVELPDAQDVNLTLEPEGKLHFSATAGAEKIPYEVNIDLFDKVDVNVRAAIPMMVC